MGWRDRDWARFDESERKAFYKPGPTTWEARLGPTREAPRIRVWAIALAAGVSLALLLLGHLPRGHPLVPALAFRFPFSVGSSHVHMATGAAEYGSNYTINGTTPDHADGSVEADGSWNGGPWQLLFTGAATDGSYAVSFAINQHGSLDIRVKYPGGEADGTVLVP